MSCLLNFRNLPLYYLHRLSGPFNPLLKSVNVPLKIYLIFLPIPQFFRPAVRSGSCGYRRGFVVIFPCVVRAAIAEYRRSPATVSSLSKNDKYLFSQCSSKLSLFGDYPISGPLEVTQKTIHFYLKQYSFLQAFTYVYTLCTLVVCGLQRLWRVICWAGWKSVLSITVRWRRWSRNRAFAVPVWAARGLYDGVRPACMTVLSIVIAMECRERWNELNSRVMFSIKRKEKTYEKSDSKARKLGKY